MRTKSRSGRLSVVGLVVGLIVGGTLAFAGVTFAGTSPPTSVNTCTPVNHHGVYGKPKVTTGTSCPGTKYFQAWANVAYLNDMQYSSTRTDYTKVDWSGLEVPESSGGSNYSGDNFTNATLWQEEDNNFDGANFTGATFLADGGYIGGFDSSNFNGANFTNAFFEPINGPSDFNFTSSTFVGAIWNNTGCPDGTDSNNDSDTCVGHGIP